jgi:hypothetical protein
VCIRYRKPTIDKTIISLCRPTKTDGNVYPACVASSEERRFLTKRTRPPRPPPSTRPTRPISSTSPQSPLSKASLSGPHCARRRTHSRSTRLTRDPSRPIRDLYRAGRGRWCRCRRRRRRLRRQQRGKRARRGRGTERQR